MKTNTFIVVLSITIVSIGALVVLAEMSLLVHFGETLEMALIESIYSGGLGWVTLAAVLSTTDWFYDHITNKIIKK